MKLHVSPHYRRLQDVCPHNHKREQRDNDWLSTSRSQLRTCFLHTVQYTSPRVNKHRLIHSFIQWTNSSAISIDKKPIATLRRQNIITTMFVETRLMNKLSISYADATTLVSKAHHTLGIRTNDRDAGIQVYCEAKRIHLELQRRQRERLATRRPGQRWKRATVMPLWAKQSPTLRVRKPHYKPDHPLIVARHLLPR
jgi:hypothetical protein